MPNKLQLLEVVVIIVGWLFVYFSTKNLQKLKAIESICNSVIADIEILKDYTHEGEVLDDKRFKHEIARVSKNVQSIEDIILKQIGKRNKSKLHDGNLLAGQLRKMRISVRQNYTLDSISKENFARIEDGRIQLIEIQRLLFQLLTVIY